MVDEVQILRLLRSISDDLRCGPAAGVHGVPPFDLADRLRRAVGFRNVLVHDYVEVDDGIVIDRLGNLVDLDDFVAAVAGWVVPPRS